MTEGEQAPVRSTAWYAAGFVTIIFHPLFLVLYGLLLIFTMPDLLVYMPGTIRKVLFTMVLVNNVILPVAILPLLRLRNVITSYTLSERSERVVPLMVGSLMYFVSAVMIFRFHLPGMIKAFMFASACVGFTAALLNLRWKISVHSMGAGAMVATVLVLSFKMYTGLLWIMAAVFMTAGLVMAARLYLRAHTPAQVYFGFLAGLTVMALGMLI
jgi:hypothetical protein